MARNLMRRIPVTAGIALLTAWALAPAAANAENIKIGTAPTTGSGPVYIAQEKGYFAAEGLTAELVRFESSQPIGVAVVSGDLDFGVAGISGGLYSLAGQGALRIIGGAQREAPGFHLQGYAASKQAYAGGLTAPKNLPGHSFAVSQIGSTPHYALALLAEKYGLNLATIRIVPLQSIANIITSVSGGTSDAAITTAASLLPAVQRGDVKLLGWVGDETLWQVAVAFVSTKTADSRADLVTRFLRAYRKGTRDYHDAFVGPDGKRADGPTAPQILAIIAKYLGQTPAQVAPEIPYIDRDARLDVKDVLHQIAWFKSQGMVKGEVDGDAIIDKRYVVPLPEQ